MVGFRPAATCRPTGVIRREVCNIQNVPEPKRSKNRVHLDVNVSAGLPVDERRSRVDSEVERVMGLGAARVQTFEQSGEYWVVMHDPEGNEFCLQ